MRIGLIIYGRLDTLTGGYIYDQMLVKHLRQRGHHIEVVSLDRKLYAFNIFDNFSSKLFSGLRSAGYDLLLQDELTHPSLWWINRRLRQTGQFPVVAMVHQVLCRQSRNHLINRLYEAVERPYFNSVDACIYNSATTRRTVEHVTLKSLPSMVAFPAGNRLGGLGTPDLIESRAREAGPLQLIFVGNVLPHKGLLPLIDDLSHLSPKPWHLRIVGDLEMDPVYYAKVKEKTDSAELTGQVIFAGPKKGPELSRLLTQSHVFVMPYSHEGFGMAHLEAMGFGLPVIGCAGGAVKEYVKHEKNGFLVDPANRRRTVAYLNRLNSDRQLLSHMGLAAWQTFQKHPRWEDTMDRIESFLLNLIRGKVTHNYEFKG